MNASLLKLSGILLFSVVLAACAASTPPPSATPEAQAPASMEQAALVLPDALPMSRENAQAMYLMVKKWRTDPEFIEKGFEADSPYARWYSSVKEFMFCDPGPGCPAEEQSFLRRLSMLGMLYRDGGGEENMMTQTIEQQIEGMLQLWNRNPEFLKP